MMQMLRKTVWRISKILNIELPHESAIPLPGIYPRAMKAHVHTMFIIALFIAQKWKQTKCLSIDDR